MFGLIFCLIFLCIFIITISGLIKFSKIGKKTIKFEKNIDNKAVKEYIELIRKTRIINQPRNWNVLRSGFTLVNNSMNIDTNLKKELMNALLSKGCNLGNVRIVESQEDKEKRKNESIKESGRKGEETVKYNVKWLPEEYKVLHNVKLPHNCEEQEIDSIIIGPNGIFHVETKNHGGEYGCKIIINRNGDWIREDNGVNSGVENPSFQIKRHERVLNDYLKNENLIDEKIPVVGIIVLSNSKTILEGQENSVITVIKADRLTDYIESYRSDLKLSKDMVNQIYSSLQKYCI